MRTRMRRRPAVGVVTCNRRSMLFRICLPPSSRPTSPQIGSDERNQTYIHSHFRVTTAYITHKCSTVQSTARPRHTHVHVLCLQFFFTASILLSIYLTLESPLFFTLSLLISRLSNLQPFFSLCLPVFVSRLLNSGPL
jgi:hypothetical protein